jgi:DNA polymerase-3 subunit delta'
MAEDPAPLADQRDGAPHPRMAPAVIGQDAAQAAFLTAVASGRMHSGWLISGPEGVGKATLAYRIAAFLLSGGAGGGGLFGPPATLDLPGSDPDLRRIRAGSHPRLFTLRRTINPDTDRLRKDIVVEDARDLRHFFAMSATDGGHRAVIVDTADDLNPASANAILKLLEEPPPRTTLLILAHQPARLLPTIRSRCRSLPLHPLAPADMAAALAAIGIAADQPDALAAIAGGSVGHAVRLLRQDGLPLYADIVRLFSGLPRLDRVGAIRLAESVAPRAAEERFALLVDLIDLFLARAARAGILGEPGQQGAPGEARLLARLAPHDQAARLWAQAAQALAARVRQGRAVNLDPAALILDMLLSIEATARKVAAA